MGRPMSAARGGRGPDPELLYGIHPVLEALRAERPLRRIYLLLGRRGPEISEILKLGRSQGALITEVRREVLDRLAGRGAAHQGVVAFGSAARPLSLSDLLKRCREREEPPFLILLDGVEDPRNLGAVLRTADAAGAHGVVLPQRRSAGLSAAAAKTSAGAIDTVPVATVINLNSALEELKSEGLWSYLLDREGADYRTVDLTGPVVLIAGGEGRGAKREMKKRCDFRLSIPMRGKIESLNVSVAVAVAAYEVRRQRDRR